jgi:hypothetical protein
MSCILLLLMIINVVVVVFRGYPGPLFISKWARVIRKVPESITIVVLVGLYIYLPICKI